MLAKAAVSLDRLRGGRIELGIGSGAFQDGIAAMGGPQHTPGEAVAATEEASKISRLAWSTAPSVSFFQIASRVHNRVRLTRAMLLSYIHFYIHFALFAANRSRPPAAAHCDFWLVSAKIRT